MAKGLSADLEADDKPSLLLMSVDALVFWMRNPLAFWIVALPIASLAGIATWVIDRDHNLDAWRGHWGWSFLFALIYAMFLDRWMKETLLDGALPSDEADEMRRSTIAARFLTFAIVFCLMALATAPSPFVELNIVACAAAASFFVLILPALAAHKPMSLQEAFMLGRPLRAHLFLLVGGTMVLSLFTGLGLDWLGRTLDHKAWIGAALAAAQRVVDCLLLAGLGYGLATIFRTITDWHQPEPADHPFRGMRMRARSA